MLHFLLKYCNKGSSPYRFGGARGPGLGEAVLEAGKLSWGFPPCLHCVLG